jgi:hypothetical protein
MLHGRRHLSVGRARHRSVPLLERAARTLLQMITVESMRVAVEKLHFRQDSENLGDTKCPGKPRTSFLGLPIAKVFSASFW